MMDVAATYSRDTLREWQRLERDAFHRMELLITLHHLRRFLPEAARILDAGGGPGRYALQLCRDGHRVALMDVSPGCIEFAKTVFANEPASVQERLLEATVGDIRDLSRYEDASFAAVLCLGGPLTHLNVEADRIRAVRELTRVTAPGGVLGISVMGRLAAVRTILAKDLPDLGSSQLDAFVATGDTWVDGMPWHFFRAAELQALVESAGAKVVVTAGCESLSCGLAEATNRVAAEPNRWSHWVELAIQASAEPSVADMSEHILCICHFP